MNIKIQKYGYKDVDICWALFMCYDKKSNLIAEFENLYCIIRHDLAKKDIKHNLKAAIFKKIWQVNIIFLKKIGSDALI